MLKEWWDCALVFELLLIDGWLMLLLDVLELYGNSEDLETLLPREPWLYCGMSEVKLLGALIVAEPLELLGVMLNWSMLKSQSCAISPFCWLDAAMSMG